ncbi:MAG TPA: VOC family protein [Vicinamibacterales bacterium]|nr:VOC family protein [Vicinamibacterales bacterium]
MAVKPVPEGYHSVTAALIVHDGVRALDFYKKAFGAQELMRMPMGDKIGHAEFQIGDTRLMLSDEWPDMGLKSPKSRGGTTVSLMIYVPDVDAAFKRAVDAGGTVERPVENQFYGDRSGTLIDPFGHRWTLSTHVEDVSPEEMNRRMEQWTKAQAGATK